MRVGPTRPGPRHEMEREGREEDSPHELMFDRHFPHWPPGVPQDARRCRAPASTTTSRSSARRYPDKAAIVYYGSTHHLRARSKREVDALAGFLQQRCGVKRGDRVLLYAQNCPQFIIGYYAHPARRRGGGAGQPDEQERGAARTTSRTRTRAWRSSAQELLGANRAACRQGPRRRCIVADLLGLPREADRSAGAGFRARAAPWTRAPEVMPVEGRARRGLRAARARGRPGRPRGAALYLGHDRASPKGCMLHAREPACRPASACLRLVADVERGGGAGRAADVPPHRHAGEHEHPDPARRHARC